MTVQADFKDPLSKVVDGKKRQRRFRYTSGNFSGLLLAVSRSDLLLTAPTSLLRLYGDLLPLQFQPCPVEVTPIEMQMVWHGLTNQNPLRKWFRQLVKEVSGHLGK